MQQRGHDQVKPAILASTAVPDTDLRGGTYPAVVVQGLEALKPTRGLRAKTLWMPVQRYAKLRQRPAWRLPVVGGGPFGMCACSRRGFCASASLEARASNIRYCFDSSAPRSRWRRGLVTILIFWLTDSGVRGRFLGCATLCRCTLHAVSHACPTLESSLQPLQLCRSEWWRRRCYCVIGHLRSTSSTGSAAIRAR